MTKSGSSEYAFGGRENAKTPSGAWIQVYTGGKFHPLAPKVSEVHLEDIAHSLAMKCRFSGHTKDFYSVAQHSVLVAMEYQRLCPWHPTGVATALLHDADEAYFPDVASPIKCFFPEFKQYAGPVSDVIMKRFELIWKCGGSSTWGWIKGIDTAILFDERDALLGPGDGAWGFTAEPLGLQIKPWGWKKAKRKFLEMARELHIR